MGSTTERRSRKNTRKLLPSQSPRGFTALAGLYYFARPKSAMLRRLPSLFPTWNKAHLIVSINFLAPCLRFIMFCAYLQYHQNRCFVPWYVKESRFQRILHRTGCTASIECNGCTECTLCSECTVLPAEFLTHLYVNVLDSFSLKKQLAHCTL